MKRTSFILLGLFSLTIILMMVPSYYLLVKPRQQAFDLFWIWAGGRAIWAGENPYGTETTRLIQLSVFKRVLAPNEYQHSFPHPAHIAFVLWPFIILPFMQSILLWTSLQIPLFMVSMVLGLNLLKWTLRPPTLFGLLLLTSLGFRYPIIVYVIGQLAIFIIFCLLMSVWLFRHHHARAAAFALACTTIRPDLALLAILLALLFIRHSPQRHEFISTLIEIGIIFALLPVPFLGLSWPLIWLEAIGRYGNNPNATYPPNLLPSLWLRGMLFIVLIGWVGTHLFWTWRNPTFLQKAMLVSAIIPSALMLLPQTGSYNLTFLLISAVILLSYAKSSRLKYLMAVTLLTPWLYFLLGSSFDRWIFLLIPSQFILWQLVEQLGIMNYEFVIPNS